jgi:GT2 family glycosyltransferase
VDAIIVIPYVVEQEIRELKARLGYKIPVYFWEDKSRIGSDLAYQTLWNMFPDNDIIILHADMLPLDSDNDNNWYTELCNYAKKYKEAGIFGTTLLYPRKDSSGNFYIQHAGGQFVNGEAIHFGGGLELFNSNATRQLVSDEGQYDKVREVSWVTFGGIYIRRSVLDVCGPFDPSYMWTYYRDVDYCLTARSHGFKIYQTPVKLLHFEGKDNKRIQSQDPVKTEKVSINQKIFFDKWNGSELLNTIDVTIA